MSDDRERPETAAVHTAALAATPAAPPLPEMERIYKDYARLVFRAAYRVTGSAQDAEDVLQTVFLRLVRGRGATTLSDNPGHYLQRAAVNAAVDLLRSRRADRTTSIDSVAPALASEPGAAPDRVHDDREIQVIVRRALAELSPKAAEIFSLRYFEGYDNHEIARLVGTSRTTVGVILHRARQRVRDLIAGTIGAKP